MFCLDLIRKLIVHPAAGIREAVRTRPVYLAFVVGTFAVLSRYIATLLMTYCPAGKIAYSLLLGCIVMVCILFVNIFFFSSLYHFVASLMGGVGNGGSLYITYCLSTLPFIFLVPITLIHHTLYWPALVLLWLWVFILRVKSIAILYSFSLGKALAVILIPILAGSLIFWFILVLLLIAAAVFLGGTGIMGFL